MGFLSKIGSSIGSSAKGMFGNISSSARNVFNGLTNQISENFSAKSLSNMATNIAGGIFNKTLSSLKDGVLKGLMNGLSGSVNIPGLVAGESGDFYMQDYLYTLVENGLFGLDGYSTFSDAYTTDYKNKQYIFTISNPKHARIEYGVIQVSEDEKSAFCSKINRL